MWSDTCRDFVYPGWLGGLFAGAKDFVELAVLAAVAYAFYRRFVQKPERLEANREAILILSLIAAIMVTDLVFDGFRFALVRRQRPGHRSRTQFCGGRFGAGVDVRRPP